MPLSNFLPELATCTRCPLHENGFVVPGYGPANAQIMAIGEAPGEVENNRSRPFQGPSGELLKDLLASGGFDIDKIYVTNLTKHWPGPNNPTPNKSIWSTCAPWLFDEIKTVDPDIILCIGALAATAILGKINLRKEHGTGRDVEIQGRIRRVYILYHPAAGMHDPSLKETIRRDYSGLAGVAKPLEIEGHWLKEGEYLPYELDPNLPLAVDLETNSLDTDTNRIVCVSFTQERGVGYVTWQVGYAIRLIIRFISQGGLLIFHNAQFDAVILRRYGVGIDWRRVFDTMLSGYILGNERGLKQRALKEHNILMETYNDVGDGEKDASKILPEDLWYYACGDAEQTLEFYYEDIEEVKTRGIQEALHVELGLLPVIHDMHRRGIYVDQERLKDLKEYLDVEVDKARGKVFDILGRAFEVDSGPQLEAVLFTELGLKRIKMTPKKTRWSTDSEVLIKLLDAHPICQAILEYRKLAKLKSTYVDSVYRFLRPDGRIHPYLNQVGASTFRFSGEKPNIQNQPARDLSWKKKIRGLYRAGPGKKLVAIDFSQGEIRSAAGLSRDRAMIDIFDHEDETRIDIHTNTVRGVLHSETDISSTGSNLRTLAKNINFGSLFGLRGNGLQRYLAGANPPVQVGIREAVEIVDGIRSTYPDYMAWCENLKEFVLLHGYVETIQGRRKYFVIDPKDPEFKDVINMPIQGTFGGDIMRDSMVALYILGFPIIVNVHDELLFEFDADVAEVLGHVAAQIMTERAQKILNVKIKVKVSIGDNWGEMTEEEDAA